MLEQRQGKTVDEKGLENILKELRFLRASRKGKGKGNKTKVRPHCASRNDPASGSTTGILHEIFVLFAFSACVDFCALFLLLVMDLLLTVSLSIGMKVVK